MRKEIAILVVVAIGSMVLGFLLVLLLIGPGDREPLPDPFSPGHAGPGVTGVVPMPAAGSSVQDTAPVSPALKAPSKVAAQADAQADAQAGGGTWAIDPLKKPGAGTTGAASGTAGTASGTAGAASGTAIAAGAGSAQVAPAAAQKYSGKIALAAQQPFVWRCWAEGSDVPLEKDACGTLSGVDGVVDRNMGAIEQCLLGSLGASAAGTLSLALKIDYTGSRVKAWLGNSTKIDKLDAVSGCIRTKLEGEKPPAVDHAHAVYIVFVTIDVGKGPG